MTWIVGTCGAVEGFLVVLCCCIVVSSFSLGHFGEKIGGGVILTLSILGKILSCCVAVGGWGGGHIY